jgi:hypothetical protein
MDLHDVVTDLERLKATNRRADNEALHPLDK